MEQYSSDSNGISVFVQVIFNFSEQIFVVSALPLLFICFTYMFIYLSLLESQLHDGRKIFLFSLFLAPDTQNNIWRSIFWMQKTFQVVGIGSRKVLFLLQGFLGCLCVTITKYHTEASQEEKIQIAHSRGTCFVQSRYRKAYWTLWHCLTSHIPGSVKNSETNMSYEPIFLSYSLKLKERGHLKTT